MSSLVIETPEVFEPLLANEIDGHSVRYKGAHGGRGCCHPDTLIDTPKGQVKISEFQGGPVYSWHNGEIIEAVATPSVSYDEQQLYMVTLKNGASISVTDQHRFLTGRGWVQCCDLSMSDEVVFSLGQDVPDPHQTNQGISQQVLRANVQHLMGKLADSLESYFGYLHQHGQPLQCVANSGQVFSPSQAGELQHNSRASMHLDAPAFLRKNSLSLPLRHLPNQYAHQVLEAKNSVVRGSCIDGKASGQLLERFQQSLKSHAKNARLQLAQVFFDIAHGSGFLRNQGKTRQKEKGIEFSGVHDSPSYTPSCKHDLPILVGIDSICKHDRLVYWDLHVPFFENYLSNGIVNHNSGKSHFFGELWLEENIADKYDFVCIRETLKSLEFSVKKLLEAKISQYNAGAYFEVQDRRIMSKHGGVTIFEGMQNHTSDSIKSLEGFDRAWFEEAQNASEKSLTLLRPTIRKPGSQLWFGWNPDKPTDPIDQLLRGIHPPPNSIVVQANYLDNPFLPQELRDEMEYDKRRDPDKYAHVWLGEYQRNSETRVFKNWRIEEFERPEGTIFRLGADWGFSVDPSVLVRSSIEGNILYVDYEAWAIGCEITNLPELFFSVPDAEKWPITADSARPETISHMVRNGFPKMRAAIKGAKSIEDGIEWLKSFDIVVHPRCKHLIDELTLYSYKTDQLTGKVLPLLQDKYNHVIDALRYACEGARRAKPERTKPKSDIHRLHGGYGWMA